MTFQEFIRIYSCLYIPERTDLMKITALQAIFVLIICWGIPVASYAQTCCTGGPPLTGSLNLRAIQSSGWGISLTYDDNKIEDYILDDELISESTIKRYSRTVIAQIDYGITKNLTGTILVPYIWMGQSTQGFNGTIEGSTSGIGDILFMIQYGKLLKNQNSIVFSGGIKLPVGETQNTTESGRILPATLQSGTGSIDFFISLQYQTSFKFRRSVRFTQTFNTRINTVSKNLTFHNTYRFGHVFQSFSGFSDQIVIAKVLNTPSLTFRYRYSGRDLLEGFPNENTGGHWFSIAPGWAVNITQNFLVGINAEFPIYRNLNGLQITTTRKLVATIQFLLPKKNQLDL